jgi:hypothetical protein
MEQQIYGLKPFGRHKKIRCIAKGKMALLMEPIAMQQTTKQRTIYCILG